MVNETCKTLYYTAEDTSTNKMINLSKSHSSLSLTDLVNITEPKLDSDIKSITMHSTPFENSSLNLKNLSQPIIDFTPSPVNDLSNDSDLNDFNTTTDFEKNLIEFEAKLHSIILLAKHNSVADLTGGLNNSQIDEMNRIKILLAEKNALKKYRQLNKLMCKSMHSKKRLKKLRMRI